MEKKTMQGSDYASKIKELKKEKDAIILAHNYQISEVQDIADFTGDSYELAKKVKETPEKIIVFCGVRFMAEMAHILNPEKKVIIPRIDAGCPMADTITKEDMIELKEKYPDHKFIGYVNTYADVKAYLDACCTSSNAENIVRNIDSDKIVFIPDKNLGNYIQAKVPEKEMIVWNGSCSVHERITLEAVKRSKEIHDDAMLIVHPECRPEVVEFADEALGTGGMIRYAKASKAKKFLIGTEEGMIYRLQKEMPDKEFYVAAKNFVCPNMKKTRLKDIYEALLEEKFEILLDEDIREKAKSSMEAMFYWGNK